jgi:Predicted transcriptional regulator
MAIKYYKLLDYMNRNGISKTKLMTEVKISTPTMAKISNHQNITTDMLDRICAYLNVQPGDIMEFVPNDEK